MSLYGFLVATAITVAEGGLLAWLIRVPVSAAYSGLVIRTAWRDGRKCSGLRQRGSDMGDLSWAHFRLSLSDDFRQAGGVGVA
ncbi:hypothetical protein NPIL_61001 [Nephila pilipes]|uniref:Uncharacterized protein n=1 Tax=Nephila pilipes TaxID=299642 RepID=A0A8X6NNY2_NEPPI|nr:hypothetical protein NPIL_61001 [Nephila pilipes]